MAGKPFDEPMSFNYKTYGLDARSPNLAFLTGKYAALSLRALTTDPHSFGMTYGTEASFSPSDWAKRVSRLNVHLFICVAHPPNLPVECQDIEHGAWVGMVTQIGSTPKSIFWLPDSGCPEPLEDDLETHWHQTATWIDPSHRGRGLAQQIIETAVKSVAQSIVGSVKQARVRAFIGPYNEASKKLYGSRGFLQTGNCTIAEAMDANGNKEYLFQQGVEITEEMMNQRMGVIMERFVRRKDLLRN